MLGESVHPAVHHSVTVSKVTLHSFEQGRGLGSGIRSPSSQRGQGSRKICVIWPNRSHLRIRYCSRKKSVFICEICGTMLKTRNPLAISDISLIFAPCRLNIGGYTMIEIKDTWVIKSDSPKVAEWVKRMKAYKAAQLQDMAKRGGKICELAM